jgi:hypothetical protein
MIAVGNIGPWAAGLNNGERVARCRELRALAHVYLGPEHRLTQALGQALIDPAALEAARTELGSIPALSRRRLLASYAALLPIRPKSRAVSAP